MFIRVYSCPGYGKKMKLANELTKYINAYISQIICWVFVIGMQPKYNMPMTEENDDGSKQFGSHKDDKSTLEN